MTHAETMKLIHASNRALNFSGDTETAISFVENLRHAYEFIDMPKLLNDFVFAIEVALQDAGVLDEDFNRIPQMSREQMVQALTKYEIEWLMENQEHLDGVSKFLSSGGYNSLSDDELKARCIDNKWLEV